MPIKKLPSGGYEVRYDTYDAAGIRKQHRRRFDKQADAKAFQAAQQLSGNDETKLTVKEYLDKWLAHVKQHRRPVTYAHYEQQVNKYFLPNLEGNIRLTRFKRLHAQAVLDKLIAAGLSVETVKAVRRVVSTAMTAAIRDELISTNPMKYTITGGKPARKKEVLDEDGIAALLARLEGKSLYMPVYIAAHLGLSRGEVSALRWSDFDADAATLTIHQVRQQIRNEGITEGGTKTEARTRTLQLPPFIVEEFKREKKRQLAQQVKRGERYSKSDFLCRCRDGHPMSPNNYPKRLKPAVTAIGHPGVTFHGLRHSCASLLIAHGTPITDVSEILGHASVQITAKVYAHALSSSKKRVADKLQEIFGQK